MQTNVTCSYLTILDHVVNCKKVGKSCVNPVYNNLKYTSEEFKGAKLDLISKKGV